MINLLSKINYDGTDLVINSKPVKGVVCVGDSYAYGITYKTVIDGWPIYLKTALGLNNNNFFYIGMNEAGFSATGNDYKLQDGSTGKLKSTFSAGLQKLADTMSEDQRYNISHIIVAGGWNDYNKTSDSIASGVYNFMQIAKMYFPNSAVICGCIGRGSKDFTKRHALLTSTYPIIAESCRKVGIGYVHNLENILHDYSLISNDYVHPTDNGYKEIGRQIANVLITGNCYVYYSKPITLTPTSHYTGNTVSGSAILQNDLILITIEKDIDLTPDNTIINDRILCDINCDLFSGGIISTSSNFNGYIATGTNDDARYNHTVNPNLFISYADGFSNDIGLLLNYSPMPQSNKIKHIYINQFKAILPSLFS